MLVNKFIQANTKRSGRFNGCVVDEDGQVYEAIPTMGAATLERVAIDLRVPVHVASQLMEGKTTFDDVMQKYKLAWIYPEHLIIPSSLFYNVNIHHAMNELIKAGVISPKIRQNTRIIYSPKVAEEEHQKILYDAKAKGFSL
jgi:hypothetical protein